MPHPPESRVALGVGRVFRRSLALSVRHPGIFLSNAVFSAVTILLGAWLRVPEPAFFPNPSPSPLVEAATDPVFDELAPYLTGGQVLGALLGLAVLLGVALLLWACQNAIRVAAVEAALGRPSRPWLCFRRALRWSLAWLLTALAIALMLSLGLTLLILPALYVLARYYPWTQTVIFEGAGWHGLARARDLTAGYRWPIAAALLPIGLAWLAGFATVGMLSDAGSVGPTVAMLVTIALTTLFSQYTAFFDALLYLRLREINDGTPPPELAPAYDPPAPRGALSA
ncbi:MAG: hypothetical protein DI556_10215 [Rhodovulum sulfidophilum]|uniref:Glycerophosphoryl diester phosphodiesterase membrane domain-containing protein n=1 Tax=Rhodovulum sulfidophilum TaxID=35806 RepID=A0A2W5NBA7_RHOSU|nr:MAG: hypothetical protein DI556_10215 [Rhodovulum sulfidophilum]